MLCLYLEQGRADCEGGGYTTNFRVLLCRVRSFGVFVAFDLIRGAHLWSGVGGFN